MAPSQLTIAAQFAVKWLNFDTDMQNRYDIHVDNKSRRTVMRFLALNGIDATGTRRT